ncbi:hypothetical protein, partial [Asanoa sp. NPDC050611]|uniref:hypothetical protein n=1 Tax=Asanoa sp. NPDC050611 TaxID=3157098 RepID=UPI0033EC8484
DCDAFTWSFGCTSRPSSRTAGVRLGWALRTLGEPGPARAAVEPAHDWYRAAGGGDAALFASCLLAALDADADEPLAGQRLEEILIAARRAGDGQAEALALETLARSPA